MRYVKWTFRILLVILVLAFLHYNLPQHDVVRITSTEVIRMDFTRFNRFFFAQADQGTTENPTRDIRLINAVRPNGRVIVYRNEDTGVFGWPPYFKVDSSNLQAEAADLISTRDNPQWTVVTHYGWRNEFLTIFPNAIAIRPVDSPDVRIIPWVNIVILTVLALVLFMIRRMWLQFRERTIDPALENVSDAWDRVDQHADAAGQQARGVWARFRAWLNTWRGKPRR